MLFTRTKSPLALKYFKSIRTFMVAPGAWPAEIFGEKISVLVIFHRATLPYHTSLIVVGKFYYIWMHMDELSFLDLGHMIITALLGTLTAVRSILPPLQNYHMLLLKFINVMHLMHSTNKGRYYNQPIVCNFTRRRFGHIWNTVLIFGQMRPSTSFSLWTALNGEQLESLTARTFRIGLTALPPPSLRWLAVHNSTFL
ncbi:uncharacterized protein LOC114362601 isoform X4 [Ostrinia furnacalis]|uniref:uncharacterized protein LOC114362601 isoform X4 n=1 Tax=Ostrinia furnacalis TaxID=93504 RepID=UPI00103E478D|nr:uncharacterized protein LOC114362601 isoform X4 [Ostrinia furnacalis]